MLSNVSSLLHLIHYLITESQNVSANMIHLFHSQSPVVVALTNQRTEYQYLIDGCL